MNPARRAGVLRALAASLALALAFGGAGAGTEALVLTLHRVGGPTNVTYAPSTAALARQVASLQAQGARFVTASQLLAEIGRPGPLLAAITFDDGDASVHREALPLLRSLGIPATVFVITDRIGRPGSMSPADLRELLAAGWDVGSHTASHAALGDLTPASVRRELAEANAALEALLGIDGVCLAYPFGWHDGRIRAIASEFHACAFTTAPGRTTAATEPMAHPRPASSFLDGAGLDWRVDAGLDPLALAVSAATVGFLLPSRDAPSHAPPTPWQPAAWRTLGHGRLETRRSSAGVTLDLALRDGAWSAQAWRAWGDAPAAAVSLGHSLGAFTVGVAWIANDGPGVGAAVDLAQRGEAWAWWSMHGGWRLGAAALVADGLWLSGAWQLADAAGDARLQAELRAAVPMWPEEGHPLSLAVGHDGTAYGRVAARVGSHELAFTLDARGGTTIGLLLRW